MGRRLSTGRIGWGRLLVGRRLGFGDEGVGGEDSIQGHAEAIRWRQHSREGAAMAGVGHGVGAGVAPASRPTVRHGKTGKGKRDKV
jgi:hypothetical protein